MRQFILLWALICNGLAATSQPKVVFENTQDNEIDYPGKALDSFLSFSKYNAVIFGETHTVYFEPEFKLNLIKQLNDMYGVRDVFMEIGHSAAFLFNRYLGTGDTMLFIQPRLTYTWTPGNYRNFWMNLYRYNQKLPEGEKIIIHGVDFERQDVFKTLLLLRPNSKSIPPSLAATFQLLTQYAAEATDDAFDEVFITRLNTIRELFKGNADAVRDYYGDNYKVVAYIINNNGPHTTRTPLRNRTMFHNMQDIIAENHIEKMVGFFGAAHTDYQTGSSLPNQVNTLAGFKGKVLNINSLYYNAYSNSTKSTLDYVGLVKPKQATKLYDVYLTPAYRASLFKSERIDNKFLSRAADYVLFVNDSPKK